MSKIKKVKLLFDSLIKQDRHEFPSEGYKLTKSPESDILKRGVYLILHGRSVLHVGGTPRAKNGIQQRLENHLRGQSSFTKAYFNKDGSRLRKGCSFKYLPIHNDSELRAFVEHYAIGMLCPKHIGKGI